MALRGHWGIAIVVTLLWTLIYTAISASIILALILGGALMVGLARAFIRLYRYGDMHVEDMFYGFYNGRFTNTISMYLQIILYTFLWSLLFVIPGIIAAYRYSMAHYILMDHPEMTGSEAIEASKALMTGRKWKLFCLQFSFIGWYLLGALTFGILYIWIAPYETMAEAAFYDSIADEIGGVDREETTSEDTYNNTYDSGF